MALIQRITIRNNISRTLSRHGEILVFALLAMMMVIGAILSPLFLTPGNLSNVIRQSAPLGIVAIGQTLAILTFGIDLSVSSVATFAGVIAAVIMMGEPSNMVPAVLAGLGLGALVGLINGFFITKYKLADFIVTLATWSFVDGLMFVYTQGKEVGLVAPDFMQVSSKDFGPIPFSVAIWMVIAIIAFLFLKYFRPGTHIYAIGGNAEAARLSGINVSFIKIVAYVLSGLLAAAGGLVLLARLGVGYPLAGREFQMDSIAAVVIGGTSLFGGRGGVWGTVAGVLIVSAMNNIFNLSGVSAFGQMVLKGLIILVVVAIRARGEKQ
jgi:ribose transport system permease protein